jgi:hypothetical protein
MSDIVEQLKDIMKAHKIALNHPMLLASSMEHIPLAIAEIERLRAALAAERERCAKIAAQRSAAENVDNITSAILRG